MRTLYFSLVESALNYRLLTWGVAWINLTKIRKRMIRGITCSKYNAHTEPLLKALDTVKIEDTMILLNSIVKYTHATIPSYLYT